MLSVCSIKTVLLEHILSWVRVLLFLIAVLKKKRNTKKPVTKLFSHNVDFTVFRPGPLQLQLMELFHQIDTQITPYCF